MRVFFLLLFSIQFSCFAQSFKNTSVLKKGDLYKFSVTQNGVYKLDYDLLKSSGVPIDDINPESIKIYGNPGGILGLTATNRDKVA